MTQMYDKENLREPDALIIKSLEAAMEDILENDAIDEYIDNNEYIGREQGKLFKEWSLPFMKFLRARADKYMLDWTIDTIDSYPQNETA